MPAITAIIPNWNGEKYLRRCFDSILAQTFDDWEVITLDDGSTDNSVSIMREYAKRDKRFKVIVKDGNTGLSDGRNIGISHAKGEYIWYIDSDDFIHPQSFEIGYKLAKCDNSDIVSFRKDTGLRTRLIIKKIFGGNVDDVNPPSLRKRYNTNCLDRKTVDDVFPYVSNRHGAARKEYQIKHCYVWQHLCRREFIQDIKFIYGITMEDFPWWSSVILHHPRVTITNFKFYYYIPTFGSIMARTKRISKIRDVTTGMIWAYGQYTESATQYEMDTWQREYVWPYMRWMWKHVRFLKDIDDLAIVRSEFRKLYDLGILDNAKSRSDKRMQKKVLNFIK